MRLESHADVLALLGLKLEDVQHSRDSHLEEHGRAAAPELHDIAQLGRVQILLWDRPEEVDTPLVDPEDQLGREEPDRVLYPLDRKEDGIAIR